MTQEHALPRWLGRMFTPEVVDFELTFEPTDGENTARVWKRKPFETTVGAVCEDCNSGWLSDMEAKAAPVLRPMIAGQDRSLTAPEQALVAAWAFKTMLTLLLVVNADEARSIVGDSYEYLRRHCTPPPSEEVWLAHYAGEGKWPMNFGYHAVMISPPGEPPPTEPNAHAASVCVGHLAFSLTGHRLAAAVTTEPRVPPDARRRLWPAWGPVVDFPPPASLAGDSELRSFATPTDWRPS